MEERSRDEWRRGFLGPLESADMLKLDEYSTRVSSQEHILLDPLDDLIGLTGKGLAESVDMPGELFHRWTKTCPSGDNILRHPSREEMEATTKCLMVNRQNIIR